MRNYLLLFLLFCCGPIIGQHLVLGIVLDEAEQPVPLATIQIWRTNNDSTLLAAGYTDDEGRFALEIKRQEPISVTASYLGYGTVRTEGGSTDFFSLQLQEEASVLAGVKISSRRINTYALQGGLALDVAGNASLLGSSGMDVIELLPAVNIVGENGVSIRGNTNVRIFINGRETNRTPASLRNLSAERIERIELYTSPPARFDAGGSGGIINVVLRKSQRAGRRLTVDGQLTTPGRIGGGLLGEVNGEKWLFTGGLRSSYADFRSTATSVTELTDGSFQLAAREWGIQHTPQGSFSLRFRPDTNLTFQVEGDYQGWFIQGQNQKIFGERTILGNTQEAEDEGSLNLAADWRLGNGHQVSISLRASGEVETNISNSTATTEDRIPSQTSTDESQLLRQFNVDYTLKPWGLKVLRIGSKQDLVDFDTRQMVTLTSTVTTDFTADLRKGGYYVEAEKEWDKWSLYGGLRYEAYTAQVLADATAGENRYASFFPSISLTYEPASSEGTMTWQATFSRRLDRPGFFDLVPLVTYNSPVAVETGNPFLLPEINSRLELTQRRTTDHLSLNWTAFYDRKINLIQTTISQPTPGLLLLRPENRGRRTSWGLEGSFEVNGSWWSTQLTANAYRVYFQENAIRGGGARLRLRQEFSLADTWKFQLIGSYRAPSSALQQMRLGYTTVDLVLTRQFGKGGPTISLRAQDIFDKRVYQYTLVQNDLRESETYKWQTRRLSLNLRVPIGNR